MFKGPSSRLRLRELEDLFHTGIAGTLSDSELLERFVCCRDTMGEAAFSALVERHGPMVSRVCGEVLNDHHAAQDAVQATFLVLARQAGQNSQASVGLKLALRSRKPGVGAHPDGGIATTTVRNTILRTVFRRDSRHRKSRQTPIHISIFTPRSSTSRRNTDCRSCSATSKV